MFHRRKQNVSILETIEKQVVSITAIPMKQCHLYVVDDG